VIAVVDYGVGNLRSAAKGLERAAREAGREIDVRVTGDAGDIRRARAVVLPGVGAFRACVENLEGAGLVDVVCDAARSGRPFLGICVGMQILFEEGVEFGSVRGLGLLPGRVTRLPSRGVKIPHMGWNSLAIRPGFAAFEEVADGTRFYFVHSYAAEPSDESLIAATAEYGGARFVAAVGRDNLFATQFHPEKSQAAGIALLRSFVRSASAPARVAVPA
jgi:imidazole glycerol-phosphate synthase subunit HisH